MTTDRYGWLRVLAYLCLLFFGMLSVSAQGQTHSYCPTDGVCTWTNTQTGPFVDKGGQVYSAQAYAGADVCAQIAAAITAMPAQGGVVDARNYSGDQTCTSGALTLGSTSKSVVLLLGNYRIISASTPVITVPGSSWIIGPNSKGGSGFSAINSTTSGATAVLWTGSYGGIRNLFLNAVGASSRGLYLQASGTTSVQFNEFTNIQINGPGGGTSGAQGVRLEAATATALVSHNTFTNIFAHDFSADFAFVTSSTVGPTDNTFINLNAQSFGGATGTGISIAAGSVNNLYGGIAEGLATGIDIENTSASSYNSFFGFRTETNTNNVVDNGTGTMFVGHSIDAATISGTDSLRTYIGQGNANALQLFPTGVQAGGSFRSLSSSCAANLPCYTASDDTGTGISPIAASHSVAVAVNGNYRYQFLPGALRTGVSETYQWSSNADPTLAVADTGLSRGAAGQVNVGNGTAGDASGTIAAASVKIGSNTGAQLVASGTSTFTTTAVGAGACQTTVTTAATNALTTDTISWAYASAPTAATDGVLHILPYVTANNVNFMRCNASAGSITPTALVINWKVIR